MLLVRTWKEVKQAGSHKDAPTKTVCQANSSFQPPFVQSTGAGVVGLLRRGFVLVAVVRPYHQLKGEGSTKQSSIFFLRISSDDISYLDWYEAKTHCCNEHPNQDDSFLCSQTHLVNKAHLDGV